MAHIQLNLSKDLFCPKLYPLLEDYSHRYEFYKGSAGSGKSYFITQKIIYRCLKEKIRVLVCRRYGTTIRNTCFQLFKDILNKWQLMQYVKIRETDFHIQFPNGSEILFLGLDEETKLLSLTDISTIFVEEIYEVPEEIFLQLNLRMRGNAPNQQILAAFNPISSHSWIYDFCVVNPPDSFLFSETTYKDNQFLNKENIAAIEDLKTRNPAKFRIYGLGCWGADLEGLVFQNWHEEDFDEFELAAQGLEHRAGMDLGFIDPSTVADTLYDEKNRRIYVFNEYYATGKQLEEIRETLDEMNLKKVRLFMDSAEPRSIDYFKRAGYNAVPCIKGANSVKARITFLQNNEIIVKPSCRHFIDEIENFSYVKDKKTGKYTEDTTHEFSHLCCDALGYAYSDIYTKQKLRTLDKSILGL